MSIILLEPIHPEAHAMLESYGDVLLLESPNDFDVIRRAPHVEALITRGRGQIRRALMTDLPDLRVVARCGVGLDNIDTDAAAELAISVVYAPGSTTTAVAEHAIMLMLALARKTVQLDNAVKAGNWAIRNNYGGFELAGKTLGIIGMGDIGKRVARLASAFDMRIVYWNRSPVAGWEGSLSLDEVLRQSDVISLSLALTDDTRHLINAERLAQMKVGALLINTARGGLVDQGALHVAIQRGHIGGYASDVLEAEPPLTGDMLVALEQSLITPHVAAITDATFRLISVSTCSNVLRVLRNDVPEPRSVYQGK